MAQLLAVEAVPLCIEGGEAVGVGEAALGRALRPGYVLERIEQPVLAGRRGERGGDGPGGRGVGQGGRADLGQGLKSPVFTAREEVALPELRAEKPVREAAVPGREEPPALPGRFKALGKLEALHCAARVRIYRRQVQRALLERGEEQPVLRPGEQRGGGAAREREDVLRRAQIHGEAVLSGLAGHSVNPEGVAGQQLGRDGLGAAAGEKRRVGKQQIEPAARIDAVRDGVDGGAFNADKEGV